MVLCLIISDCGQDSVGLLALESISPSDDACTKNENQRNVHQMRKEGCHRIDSFVLCVSAS